MGVLPRTPPRHRGCASPITSWVMEHQGWIKLHRKLINWEWYKTPNMVHLFIHMLLTANHQINQQKVKLQNIDIQRGQLLSGRNKLSADTGISPQAIRTCLNNLKSTNEITIKSTNKYSIITINKYEDYQIKKDEINQQVNQQVNQQTIIGQPTNQPQTRIYKNNKNKEEERIILYWEKWKNYRIKEFNFKFNSEDSEIEAKKELLALSDNDIDMAMKIIDYTIACGYKAFVKPDKNKKHGKQSTTTLEERARVAATVFGIDSKGNSR